MKEIFKTRYLSISIISLLLFISSGKIVFAQFDSSLQLQPPADTSQTNNNTGVLQLQSGTVPGAQTGSVPGAQGGSVPGPQSGSVPKPGGTFTLSNPLKANSVGELVGNFATIFSYLVVLFAVLALIYTGLQFILAQGKPEEIAKQKSHLLWIVIGVAVVIGANVIIRIVINTLSASGTVSPAVIKSATDAIKKQ